MKSLCLVFLLSFLPVNSFAYVNLNYEALAKRKSLSKSFCITTFNKEHSLVLRPCVHFNDDLSQAFINVGLMGIISSKQKLNEEIIKELVQTSLYGNVQRTFHNNGGLDKIIVTPTKSTNKMWDFNSAGELVFEIDQNYQTLTIDHKQFGSHTFYAKASSKRIAFKYLRDRNLLIKDWLDNHFFTRDALHNGIINHNKLAFYIHDSTGKLRADYTEPGRQEMYFADVNIIKKDNNNIFIQVIDSETKRQVYMLKLDADGLFLKDVNNPNIVFTIQWREGRMVECRSEAFALPHICNVN